MKLLTLSVDVDTLAEDLYEKPLSPEEKNYLVESSYNRILPRVINFLKDNGINATFFLIGKYSKNFKDATFSICEAGNEVGNHTFNHYKSFSKLKPEEILMELKKCHEVLCNVTKTQPVGFRAPGYTVNSTIMRYLQEMGYQYDTSIIPSWSYQFIKKMYRFISPKEKKNFFIPQELTCAFAPSKPYKLAPDYLFRNSAKSSFSEIPVSVFPLLQLPFLNAIQMRILPAYARLIEFVIFQRSFVNINFHDIEFAESADFGHVTPGLLVQNYIKIPLERRLSRMRRIIEYAKKKDFKIMTHKDVLLQTG